MYWRRLMKRINEYLNESVINLQKVTYKYKKRINFQFNCFFFRLGFPFESVKISWKIFTFVYTLLCFWMCLFFLVTLNRIHHWLFNFIRNLNKFDICVSVNVNISLTFRNYIDCELLGYLNQIKNRVGNLKPKKKNQTTKK